MPPPSSASSGTSSEDDASVTPWLQVDKTPDDILLFDVEDTTMDAELLVGVDVGCYRHDVVIGNADGVVLDHFQIDHQRHGLAEFFDRIEQHQPSSRANVSVAMEGYNGWARPLDQQVLEQKFKLYNVNNLG